jgi:hypothetical protein
LTLLMTGTGASVLAACVATLPLTAASQGTSSAAATSAAPDVLARIGITLTITPLASVQRLDKMQHQSYNAGYYNEQYTSLVSAIAGEPDVAKRKALYPALNHFLLDESFYMPTTGNAGRVPATARLKRLPYRPNDLFMLTEAWLTA